MMNPKKFCLINDILALKILISDMNERLQERIEELTEIELNDMIKERIESEENL